MSNIRIGFACISALLLAVPAFAQAPEPISIVVFGPPSLGAFLPPVIKAQKLDEKNGLAIKFEERTPDAYTAQFNSGEFKLGGSASLLTGGLAAAVQVWEPAYTTLLSKKAEMRTIDIAIAGSWMKFTGSRNIPYLGVAAHIDWVEKNPKLVAKLYAAYKEASEWVAAHPDDASKLIAPKGTPDDQKAITELIRAKDRLGMNGQRASDVAKEISSVYAAGRSIAFLPADPAASTIYRASDQ